LRESAKAIFDGEVLSGTSAINSKLTKIRLAKLKILSLKIMNLEIWKWWVSSFLLANLWWNESNYFRMLLHFYPWKGSFFIENWY